MQVEEFFARKRAKASDSCQIMQFYLEEWSYFQLELKQKIKIFSIDIQSWSSSSCQSRHHHIGNDELCYLSISSGARKFQFMHFEGKERGRAVYWQTRCVMWWLNRLAERSGCSCASSSRRLWERGREIQSSQDNNNNNKTKNEEKCRHQ